ncbi:MAG: hypothetical protein P4N59_14615 [Negativicutes bacterium]|nr:hypothetical protein [Negativicutes bacterium]
MKIFSKLAHSANRFWQDTASARERELQPLLDAFTMLLGLILLAGLALAAYFAYEIVIALPVTAAIIIGALIIGFAIIAASES